ncbi:hypothetical protein GO986_06810 [Deinococcus sp. HMF7620]|uniref:TIGR04222 domain-containing membrane protein n=1 Tax=Deinococcus arboris TaxID=2682977 RepID=A0A7C9HR09_9DEIO|nr:hypothetical protein [Deinococcus arboris]MVN86473.1 hypothetical protein [Deinococcus arboris]
MRSEETVRQPLVNAASLSTPLLWAALNAYEFPPALLRRAAQDARWTPAFTARAAQEYRRFLYLAAICSHPVTPSKAVDELWHTHLLFTRDYWERLTPLLPRPLHHEPGDGQPSDAAHFRTQYEQTLDAYAQTFGELPPADLWPDARRAPKPAPQVQGSTRGAALWLASGAGLTLLLTLLGLPLWLTLPVFGLLTLLVLGGRSNPRTPRHAPRRYRDSDTGALAFIGLDTSSGQADNSCDSSSSGDSGGGCSDGGGSSCGGGGCGS